MLRLLPLLLLLVIPGEAKPRQLRAGAAKIDITPSGPIWMSGYAVRTKPSEGVSHPIYAKALALDDGHQRIVIVTTDLIGLPRAVSDVVAARAAKQYNLERSHLLLNSSHSHSGPVVRPNLMTMYFLTPGQRQAVDDYALKLTDNLVSVIGAAIGELAPATLSLAHGSAPFAINRRNREIKPVDHDVPVFAVRAPDGKLRAVLFAYACHNTTLGGDRYLINGDYAGFAQSDLEESNPGAVALFMLLCGADQNPAPAVKSRTPLNTARPSPPRSTAYCTAT